MLKGTLTKVSDNKNAMRTTSMDGFFIDFPTVNREFHIVGTSLTENKDDGVPIRLISTSIVTEILEYGSNGFTFKTYSGTIYSLKYK